MQNIKQSLIQQVELTNSGINTSNVVTAEILRIAM